MSPSRRDFLKYTGATGLAIASSDLVAELIAQSPKGNPLTSTFKGLADVALGEAKKVGCTYADVRFTRHIARMHYPFTPAGTVEFFRQFYGPTQRAFASLGASAQERFRQDMVELQEANNIAETPGTTEVAAEYLEVVAVRS